MHRLILMMCNFLIVIGSLMEEMISVYTNLRCMPCWFNRRFKARIKILIFMEISMTDFSKTIDSNG